MRFGLTLLLLLSDTLWPCSVEIHSITVEEAASVGEEGWGAVKQGGF